MNKMLFLDDDAERHAALTEQTKNKFDWEITHVWTAEEAIKAIAENSWTIISLDHDLGGTAMVEPDLGGGSGYDVAVSISEMPDDTRPKNVIVHSWNPNGAKRMIEAMKNVENVGYIPFHF